MRKIHFLAEPCSPIPALPLLSVASSIAPCACAYFAGDANDPPLCILMQGLSTLLPFIHIQMCSYCLFALGLFKMAFWNMLFDKHIIGQVPAVIRTFFNVSKLESERGASGPTAIHCPLPSFLDMSQAASQNLMSDRSTQSGFPHPLSPLDIRHRRRDTGESPS